MSAAGSSSGLVANPVCAAADGPWATPEAGPASHSHWRTRCKGPDRLRLRALVSASLAILAVMADAVGGDPGTAEQISSFEGGEFVLIRRGMLVMAVQVDRRQNGGARLGYFMRLHALRL